MAVKLLHNNCAALVSFTDRVDATFFDTYPAVRVVGSPTTGIDHIDFAEAARRRVKILTLRGETEFLKDVTSTAEHTIGLILLIARYSNIPEPGHKLSGKRLGIIGYGRVGKQVERIALGFGMEVAAMDTNPAARSSLMPLDTLLSWSDIVTVHVPLESNEGFFTAAMFAAMKPTAFFVNTSRDGIVEPGALSRALMNSVIAGAAVDFLDSPDLVEYNEKYDNLVLTPHLGGATVEDRALTEQFILKRIDHEFRAEEKS